MLTVGTRIGAYEVIAALGAGGMGEVYRARDSRLERDVALKVLPRDWTADQTRVARFEREARQVAALNHPNVVAVFDTGRDGDVAYIVTELVEGTTLRGLSLPPRKVAEIGAQIADALAEAHRAGVTHRDIKPDNVMLTREGRVKVLDFGLAKAYVPPEPDGLTVSQTARGSIVGTVGYMAPEQVLGGSVDPRTDIFALGVLLYELLSGAPPFAGETVPDIMTATLRADPPDLPANIPEGLQRIVRRCLERKPEERFQSADDLAFALRQWTPTSGTAAAIDAPRRLNAPQPGSRVVMAVAGFTLGVLVAGGVILRWSAGRDTAIDQIRLTRLTSDRRSEIGPAISPDGGSLAYLRVSPTLSEVLVRPLESPDAVVVTQSDTPLSSPVWSSDGNQICYTDARRDFWCVGAAGGPPRRVLQNITWPRIAPNGRDILFVRVFEGKPWLYRSAAAGEPERVGDAGLSTDVNMLSPVSPDGSLLIAAGRSSRWLISLLTGARQTLPTDASIRSRSIAWLPDSRHIVVAEETTTLIGSRIVLQDAYSAARRLVLNTVDPINAVATTSDGAGVVYEGGPVERDVVEYSADGRFVRTIAASSLLEGFPGWTHTGDRIVYRAGGPGQSDSLWMTTVDAGPPTLVLHLTSNSGSQTPISPDGRRIAYVDGTGIQVVSTSGGRAVRVLTATGIGAGLCWSPDGGWIWYSEGSTRLGRVPSGGGAPQFVNAPVDRTLIDCSPNAQWMLRRSPSDFVLTSADGTSERVLASTVEYVARAENVGQFAGDGTRVYLLRLDRRTIDVFDTQTGRRLKTIAFDIPIGDEIEGFSFSPDGMHVLLTTGGERNDLWMVSGFSGPAAGWKRWFTHWTSPRQ